MSCPPEEGADVQQGTVTVSVSTQLAHGDNQPGRAVFASHTNKKGQEELAHRRLCKKMHVEGSRSSHGMRRSPEPPEQNCLDGRGPLSVQTVSEGSSQTGSGCLNGRL